MSEVPAQCVECAVPLVPQLTPAADVPAGARKHGGKGLCRRCYMRAYMRGHAAPRPKAARRVPARHTRPALEDDLDRGWMLRAACRDEDPALWFPDTTDYQQARAICDGCPVKDACLNDALALRDFAGMRAGLTPKQLRRRAREDS